VIDERAVNTVADISLALVVVTAAIALVATAPGERQPSHDQAEADQTAEVVSTATLSVPYSVASVVDETEPDRTYDDEQLRRVSHGSVATLVADAAAADLRLGESSGKRLTPAGTVYERAIAGRFQARFVGSNFETNVTARWAPYEGATMRGTATVGEPVPPTEEYSSVHLSVPSGFESVQSGAAVEHEGDYDAVAERVADALVEGYLPAGEMKRALESSGLERELAVYRYRQMARLVADTAPDDREVRRNLETDSAEPARINQYLAMHLTEQIAADLDSNYDSAQAAAGAVSTAEVTVVVRTWEP